MVSGWGCSRGMYCPSSPGSVEVSVEVSAESPAEASVEPAGRRVGPDDAGLSVGMRVGADELTPAGDTAAVGARGRLPMMDSTAADPSPMPSNGAPSESANLVGGAVGVAESDPAGLAPGLVF